jgi:phosphopantetheinyl transferase
MPLFYQHNINESTRMGIWRIEEPEDFFLKKVPLQATVSHPYKKLQHLAGRYLLTELFGDFPLQEILIADTRKPFLENERYHFSISHSGNFAAAIASTAQRVGVDIELVTSRIRNIAEKFLNDDEKKYMETLADVPQIQLELTTVYWSAKEAVFKWYGAGEVDFRQHISIISATYSRDRGVLQCIFKKDEEIPLSIQYRLFPGFVAAWVSTSLHF